MDRLEDCSVFDTQTGKVIDRKEAAPVDLVVGGAPVGQSVVLAFDQNGQGFAAQCSLGIVPGRRIIGEMNGIVRPQGE